jgi:hypothetical protein
MGTRAAATAAACDLGSSVEEFSMNEVRTHPQVSLAGAHRPLPTHSNIFKDAVLGVSLGARPVSRNSPPQKC